MRSLPLMPTGTNIKKEKVQNNASRGLRVNQFLLLLPFLQCEINISVP